MSGLMRDRQWLLGPRFRGDDRVEARSTVMPGLVPGIHANTTFEEKTWMAGTSPAMTDGGLLHIERGSVFQFMSNHPLSTPRKP